LAELDLLHLAQPAHVCYPLPFPEAVDVLRPHRLGPTFERLTESLFLHLWNEIIRRHGISKRALPPKGSLLRGLADRYQIEGWEGEYNGEAIENIIYILAQRDPKQNGKDCSDRIKRLEEACQALEREKNAILASRSWRATRYLRAISDLAKAGKALSCSAKK
jgi:hypothetical protein